MASSTLQKFVSRVFRIAADKCGEDFKNKINKIRQEREMILASSWHKMPPEIKFPDMQEIVYREIDFDTIIFYASRYLDEAEYVDLIHQIARVSKSYGEYDKADELLITIINRYADLGNKMIIANAHELRGDIYFYKNNLTDAKAEYKTAIDIYKQINYKAGVGAIKNSIGVLKIEGGDSMIEAEHDFQEAKQIATQCNQLFLLLNALLNLANIYVINGEWDDALASYEELMQNLKNHDHPEVLARVYHSLAIVYKFKKHYAVSSEYLQKSLKIANQINNTQLKGLCYLEQAEVLYYKGDYPTSTALATTAFQIFSELGDRLSLADVYKVMGMINRESKRFDLALSYFENSIKINQNYSYPLNLGESHFELGHYYRAVSDLDNAKKNYLLALDSFNTINARIKIEEVQNSLKLCIN